MQNDQDHAAHFWKLVGKHHVCMLATHAGRDIHSRPMATVARPEYNDIIMLTEQRFVKDNEIERDSHVNLSYADGTTFISVQGDAEVSRDRSLIRDCWNAGAQLYWPQGPEDPAIVAIIVTPRDIEYWEGDNKLLASVKFAYGLATKTTPSMGDNAKLRL